MSAVIEPDGLWVETVPVSAGVGMDAPVLSCWQGSERIFCVFLLQRCLYWSCMAVCSVSDTLSWGAPVQSVRVDGNVVDSTHLRFVHQEVQDAAAQGETDVQVTEFHGMSGWYDSAEGRAIVNEKHRMCVFLVQMGEGSVECKYNCIVCRSVRPVGNLEQMK